MGITSSHLEWALTLSHERTRKILSHARSGRPYYGSLKHIIDCTVVKSMQSMIEGGGNAQVTPTMETDTRIFCMPDKQSAIKSR